MGGALDQLIDVLRTLSASCTVKLSHILSFFVKYKHAGSIGAIAGFALAIVCLWRYLRGPRARRRISKQGTAPGSSSARAEFAATSTGVARSITQATHRASGPAREAATPAQVTLASAVRRQLNGGRKMTCQLLGVIIEETGDAELQNGAKIRPGAVEVMKELGRACDVYLVAKVADDASEAAILSALEDAGLFDSGTLKREKVLFCSTGVGIMSFVRQLEPDWHVDTSEETISQLKRFVRHQLWIAPAGAPEIATNVVSTPSIERYFGLSF